MKKLLAVLLLLCILAGCGPKHPEQTVPELTRPEETTDAETTQPPTAAPTEPETDLLDGMTPVEGNEGLYEIAWAAEEPGYLSDVKIYGDCLLLIRVREQPEMEVESMTYDLTLADIRSGEIRASGTWENANDVQVRGDRIVVSQWGKGHILLLDENLEETAAYDLGTDWTVPYLDQSCRYAYAEYPMGQLTRWDLRSGESTNLLPEALSFYLQEPAGDCLVVCWLGAEDDRYHQSAIRMDTGAVEPIPLEDSGLSSASCRDGLWLAQREGDYEQYLLGRPGAASLVTVPDASVNLISGPAPLRSIRYLEDGGQQVTLYREDGTQAGQCTYGPEGFLTSPVWSRQRQGYFMTGSLMDGTTRLLFWQPQAGGENLTTEPLTSQQDPRGAVSAELYDRAEALSLKYGVHIRIAEQCDTEYSNFTALQEFDEDLISDGLDALHAAMSNYPRGFFPQLLYGYFHEVQINLVGALTDGSVPEDANGFTDFAAFVWHDRGRHIMVLNLSSWGLEQTVYHEFSHIIDEKLNFHSWHHDAVYSEEAWEALNPEGFSYVGSLYDVPEEYRDGRYDGYFVDLYAQTFATEDRARVLEYAMSGNTWVFEGDFYAPLRAKLEFYARAIRDGFHTEGWPEVTRWEEAL